MNAAVSQIERQFEGLDHAHGRRGAPEVASIPTGALALDLALGVGGVPRGRIVEIFGPESSGKTTSACILSPRPRRRAGSPPSSTC